MAQPEALDFSMMLYSNRLKTFEGWPFLVEEGAKCTAEKLAQTGFYRPNLEGEPDNTRCFMCFKDLEGWEPADSPESEHKDHSSRCPFLQMKVKDVHQMSIRDYIKLCYKVCSAQLQNDLKKQIKTLEKRRDFCEDELKNK